MNTKRFWGILIVVQMEMVASCNAGTGLGEEMKQRLEPFWETSTMRGESVFFVQDNEREAPKADLLFTPEMILSVVHPPTGQVMEEGTDYAMEESGKTIRLLKDSRILFRTRESLYPENGAPNSMAAKKGSDRNLFWSEGHLFHDLQVEVTYTHSGNQWRAWGASFPQIATKNLPRTLAKLKGKEALRMVLLGDSISEGYNASGYVDAPPHQPPYGELVAASLRETYGSEVVFKNLAVAGRETLWGIGQVESLLAENPDLALIAFGMNDAGGKTPDEYSKNILQIVEPLRAHGAEVILITTMTGNPEWTAFPDPNRFLEYRDALAGLTGEGIALADVTSVWTEIVRHKKYLDLSGNGLNHPNDFGHRLYAQVILALLME